MLKLRRVLLELDGLYRANPADRAWLTYYANPVAPSPARVD